MKKESNMIEIDYLQQVHDDLKEAIDTLEGCENKLTAELDKDVLRIVVTKVKSARGWLATLISWVREADNN